MKKHNNTKEESIVSIIKVGDIWQNSNRWQRKVYKIEKHDQVIPSKILRLYYSHRFSENEEWSYGVIGNCSLTHMYQWGRLLKE